MVWQDIVMALMSLSFGYALIPQIIHCWKVKTVDLSWQTIIITSIAIWVFAFCLSTLQLWFAASTNAFSAFAWTILWIMKWKYNKY